MEELSRRHGLFELCQVVLGFMLVLGFLFSVYAFILPELLPGDLSSIGWSFGVIMLVGWAGFIIVDKKHLDMMKQLRGWSGFEQWMIRRRESFKTGAVFSFIAGAIPLILIVLYTGSSPYLIGYALPIIFVMAFLFFLSVTRIYDINRELGNRRFSRR